MLPYSPPAAQLRDLSLSCHVSKSEAAPQPQSPTRSREGAAAGLLAAPSAHIPALVHHAAEPRPRKGDPHAVSSRAPQLLSPSPAPRTPQSRRSRHGGAGSHALPLLPGPPAPPTPPTTTGSTERLWPPRERRCYLAHAALVLLRHGQKDAIEAILLLRRFLRAQPHLARHRSPQSPHATANRNRKEAGRKRKSGTSLNSQSQRSAALLPSRIGRGSTRGGEAGRVARGSVAIATAGPGPFQKARPGLGARGRAALFTSGYFLSLRRVWLFPSPVPSPHGSKSRSFRPKQGQGSAV